MKRSKYCIKCSQPLLLAFEKEYKTARYPYCGFTFQYRLLDSDILEFGMSEEDFLFISGRDFDLPGTLS